MDEQAKLDILKGVFAEAPLAPDTPLDAIGWDSMAILSVMAILRTRFGVRVTGREARAFTTIGDILKRME